MHSLRKPDIDYKEHFHNCIENKADRLKQGLLQCYSRLESAANLYEENAIASILYQIVPIPIDGHCPISANDLTKLYTYQMAPKRGRGRKVYDTILLLANGKCPFCSYAQPYTLDHYLPKGEYPEFSIFPPNLIPSCRDCNSLKLTYNANLQTNQLLHPYYDDLSAIQWLEANVKYDVANAPALYFFIDQTNGDLDSAMIERLRFQFVKLDLNRRYSIEASTELAGIEYNLRNLYDDGGEESVRDHLQSSATSWSALNINSWQAAMYRALAQDTHFHQMSW